MFVLHQRRLCIVSALLCSLSHAQLTGSITSPGNPFIITIRIRNPSVENIHILRWNNVFDDQLFIPPSFTVKDDRGNDIPFATTYAIRSGITIDDFHTLEPGQNFTRIYDLRQFLQNIPSGPTRHTRHGPKSIQIIPPTTFQGIMSSAPLIIPRASAADLSRGNLGQYSAAGLKPISLLAAPYQVQLNFPVYQNSRLTVSSPSDGVELDHRTCTGANATILTNYILDAGVYADAAHSAASDLSSTLFALFFPISQRISVKTAAKLAALTLRGNGPRVDAYCSDLQNLCDAEGSILGYSFTPSFIGSSYVVLCPAAMQLQRASGSCSLPFKKQISASASQVKFHLVMTVNNAIHSVIGNNYYGAQAVLQLSNSTTVDATKNADSYAQLAVAQRTYGEGSTAHSGPNCPPSNGLAPRNKVPAEAAKQYVAASISARGLLEDVPNYTPEQAVRDAQQCTGDQLTLVQNAAANVRALAAAARDNTDNILWKQVFNGDATVKAQVTKIFDTIAKWNTTGKNAGVNYLCDPTRRSLTCKFGTKAALLGFVPTPTACMVFCPAFFYQPAALECETPSTEHNYMGEIAGSILHELLHIRWLVDRDIQNGFSITGTENHCFEWNCVTSYAQSKNLPTFDSRNYPENVAASYVYYAFAARAAVADCSWSTYVGSMFGLQTLAN